MTPRSPYRFYVAAQMGGPRAELTLSPEESHHLIDVLRLRGGTPIDLFDASGQTYGGEYVGASEGRARVRLMERDEGERDERAGTMPEVHVAVAVLKRRAMDWLVEKLSELGVETLQPLVTARSVVRPKGARRAAGDDSRSESPGRWERIAIAAAKQCGRNRPLIVAATTAAGEWLARPRSPAHTVYARCGGGTIAIGAWLAERADAAAPRWVAVGPEGGWTPEECDGFERAGFNAVSLGNLTLRSETAALAAATLCRLG
jgi:16S rRNA (uracil1498-N3)-methyltransferase